MDSKVLLRLAAIAAIAGGALRAGDPLLSAMHFANATQQQVWFIIDLLLLFGATGIYLANRATGLDGLLGFIVFVIGILLVRSTSVSFLGLGGYQAGATVALIGIAVLAAAMLWHRTQVAASSLWLAALAAGLASRTGIVATYLVLLSGVLFGLGFVAAGTALLRKAGDASPASAAVR